MNETGISLLNRPPNILAQKGAKDAFSVTNFEHGENLTVLACLNATGHYIPPYVLPLSNKSFEVTAIVFQTYRSIVFQTAQIKLSPTSYIMET